MIITKQCKIDASNDCDGNVELCARKAVELLHLDGKALGMSRWVMSIHLFPKTRKPVEMILSPCRVISWLITTWHEEVVVIIDSTDLMRDEEERGSHTSRISQTSKPSDDEDDSRAVSQIR